MDWANIESIQVGQKATLTEKITPELVHQTAAVTGDHNPLHVDVDAAIRAGQSRPVAHGVILLGLISRLIGMRLPGPGSVWYENAIEFLGPVFAGDEIEVTGCVSRVSVATGVVVLDIQATKLPNSPVLRGTAKVRVPTIVHEKKNTMKENEKVAIVTGASRGLGRCIAEALGDRSMRVGVNFREDQTGAEEVVRSIAAKGGQARAFAANVSNPSEVMRLFEETMKAFGRIDVVVHNATPPIIQRPYMETSSDELKAFFDTYVVGLHELVRLVAPQMKERKFGRIIVILSSYLAEVPPKLIAYITGKQALYGFCRALAVELGPWNINVNMVSPSILLGPRTDELGIAAREIISRKTPLRRLAQPAEVAQTVSFLAGDEAAFISGANIPVTGGILF